jgi:hypothetical protein
VSDIADVALLFFGAAELAARLRLSRRRPTRVDGAGAPVVYGAALATAALVTTGLGAVHLAIAAVALATAFACRPALSFLHEAGFLAMVTTAQFRLTAVLWLAHLAFTADIDALGAVPLIVLAVAAALTLPILLLDGFLVQEAALRTGWGAAEATAWPDAATAPGRGGAADAPSQCRRGPKVSVHVPTYAEPPDVVIGTLDALARLDYDNVEVLVIDNNTKDETLWRPVQEHCRRLGDRFRFFHVEPLAGAKAGAQLRPCPHRPGRRTGRRRGRRLPGRAELRQGPGG